MKLSGATLGTKPSAAHAAQGVSARLRVPESGEAGSGATLSNEVAPQDSLVG